MAIEIEVPARYCGEIRAVWFDNDKLRDLLFAGRRWKYMSGRRFSPGTMYGNAGPGMRAYLCACDQAFDSIEELIRHCWHHPGGDPKCNRVVQMNKDVIKPPPWGKAACTVCDQLKEWEIVQGSIKGMWDELGRPYPPEIKLKPHKNLRGGACQGSPVFAS